MKERIVSIAADGADMDVFLCGPDAAGTHPLVLFFMDAPGVREELYAMCRRIAAAGYHVALPNLYYRHGAAAVLSDEAVIDGSAEMQRMFGLMHSLSNDGVVADTARLLAFLETEPGVDASRIGALGYCMSGPFALCVAAAWPDRVRAAVAFYGVGMVTAADDSAHLRIAQAKAEIYAGFAEEDPYAPASQIESLKQASDAAGLAAGYEVFPGTTHGFGFPGRSNYDAAAGELHWQRLLDIFARTLRP